MRSKNLFFILGLLLYFFSNTNAQISKGGQPYSFTHPVPSTIDSKNMPEVDIESLLLEDKFSSIDEPFRFGYGFDVSYNLKNSGTWEKLSDGSKLWRMQITSLIGVGFITHPIR